MLIFHDFTRGKSPYQTRISFSRSNELLLQSVNECEWIDQGPLRCAAFQSATTDCLIKSVIPHMGKDILMYWNDTFSETIYQNNLYEALGIWTVFNVMFYVGDKGAHRSISIIFKKYIAQVKCAIFFGNLSGVINKCQKNVGNAPKQVIYKI